MISFHEKKIIVSVFLLFFLGACGSPFGTTTDLKNISSPNFCPFSTRLPDGTCFDATPPTIAANLTRTIIKTPTWTWSSKTDGSGTFRYKLDDSDLSSGATETTETSHTPASDLSMGAHTLYIQEKDNSGNWSNSGSYSVTVVPTQLFIQTIGGTGNESFSSTTEVSTGGFIAVGNTKSAGVAGDALIVKLDADGNILWDKIIGGNAYEQFSSVIELSTGDFIACGWGKSGVIGNPVKSDIFVVKFDTNGNIIWDKAIRTADKADTFDKIIELSTGDLVAIGETENTPYDVLMVKFDTDGNILWHQTLGGSGDDYFNSVISLSTGGLIAVGRTESAGFNLEGFAVKIDDDGNILWNKAYGGAGDDGISSVTELSTGGYVASGNTSSAGAGGEDGFIMKLDENGDVIWVKAIGGVLDDYLASVVEVGTGGLVAAGWTGAFAGPNFYDGFLVKFNENGDFLWGKTFGAGGYEIFYTLIESSINELLLAAWTDGYGAGVGEGLFIKFDENGGLGSGSSSDMTDAENSDTITDIVWTARDVASDFTVSVPGWSLVNAASVDGDSAGAIIVTIVDTGSSP